MKLDLKRLTLQQTAALLCLSVRQINNLVGKGVIVKHGAGKRSFYVWADVFDGYLADRVAQLGGRNGHQDATDLAEAELRRTNADARLKELKADEMEGKLVDVAYVERSMGQINANVRARLLALPSKLTPQLVGIASPARVKAIVEKETNQTCEELVKIAGKAPRVVEDGEEVYAESVQH
jgi:phage terminase Nu1 subunit (DNA packaging protein)